ncbi:MAG: hypothetical protein ACLGPL_10605 [Acidobacteriota bacterium]
MERPPEIGRTDRRKIMVVGREGDFSEEVIDYATHLAERLDYDLLAVSVAEEPMGEIFERMARKAAGDIGQRAGRRGIHCEHVIRYGETGAAVKQVVHEARRIELVITDEGIDKEEVAREVTIPLFSVVSDSLNLEGDKDMADNQGGQGNKALLSTIGYGALSAALYGAVFMNADTVMQYCTKGGLYAALPIATVFVFSFAHGAFASNLWSLMGIEAMKKGIMHQVKTEVAQKRKQVQKKPRTYAYINPFHRIDK